MDIYKELYSLEGQIAYHDFLYYAQDTPIISDSAYDILVAKYQELKGKCADFIPSITPGFVGPDASLPVEPLTEPMLSVDKFKDKESIEKWQKRRGFKDNTVEEEKIDGVALRLLYIFGVLTKANLRGDGVGTVVTHRVSVMPTAPRFVEKYRLLPNVEVTGEAYVLLADLNEYAAEWDIDSPESRSTISGMLKRKQPEESDTLNIRFKAFMLDKETRKEMKTYKEMAASLQEAGFEIPRQLTPEELEEAYNAPERPIGEYAIDGIVVKSNDLRNWNDTHMRGYWTFAVCYKYPTCNFLTTLRDVIWNLNTKGYLEGVLLFDPVEYDGSTLRRAKFDYVSTYIRAGLRIGSTIEVTKANEIIPNLVGLIEKGDGEPVRYPKECPSCGEPLTQEGDDVACCTNVKCPATLLARLERACSPKGLNILSLGTKRLTRMIDSGYVVNMANLFALTPTDFDKIGIEDAIANKVIKQLETAPSLGLNNWLFALCIPHMGLTRATELVSEYGTAFTDADSLVDLLCNSEKMVHYCDTPGLAAAAWCRDNADYLLEVFDAYDWDSCGVDVPDLLPIACTGAWTHTRREIKELLTEYGYNVDEGISKTTTCLLVGEKPSPGTIAKAERWGIPTIQLKATMTVEQLVALLKGQR